MIAYINFAVMHDEFYQACLPNAKAFDWVLWKLFKKNESSSEYALFYRKTFQYSILKKTGFILIM